MAPEKATKLQAIAALLQHNEVVWPQVLDTCIDLFGCTTGTLHFLDPQTALLHLKAQRGIPEFLLPKVTTIPIGKGMAGIAAERRKPVEMCNLQTDDSGVARPAAKETKMEGSIAAPMIFEGNLYGTLGVAKPVTYDFTPEESETLMAIGALIGKFLAQGQNP